MEAVVVALRPKQSGIVSHEFLPKAYDVLLSDLHLGGGEGRLKQLPNAIISFEDEPAEALFTVLYQVTGAEKGGLKGKRAVFVPPAPNEPSLDNPDTHVKGMLYCIPIDTRDRLNSNYAEQAAHKPAFYALDVALGALNITPHSYSKQTRIMLHRLQSWLKEKYTVPGAINLLFSISTQYRMKFSVTNPAYFVDGKAVGSRSDQYSRSIANEALAKMVAIEKCDITIINPVFGSGLPFQDKVEAFALNRFFGLGKPDYSKITVPSMKRVINRIREPSWVEEYPLHKAAFQGDSQQIRELIKAGHPVMKPDHDSWAPIHYAAWHGHVEAITVLLNEGKCSPNITTDNWSTPLHFASTNGHPYVVELLLNHPEIDVNMLDRFNKTALDLCAKSRGPDKQAVADLLKRAMNKPSPELPVYLMDTTFRMLSLVSGPNTTVQQLHTQMMKDLDLPEQYSHFFTIWICSRNLELQLKSDHKPIQHLNDWNRIIVPKLTYHDPNGEDPQLYWRRDAILSMADERKIDNPIAINLLFHEAYHNYVNSVYPCADRDIIRLGGILMQLRHGNFEMARAKAFFATRQCLVGLVPAAKLRGKSSSGWIPKIQSQYQNYSRSLANKDWSPKVLQMEFLRLCWNLTVYGSAIFTGLVQYTTNKEPTKVYIGVNDIGIHIIDGGIKKNLLQSFKYTDIKWRHLAKEAILEIRLISSPDKESALAINTRQAGLINHLMDKLALINSRQSNPNMPVQHPSQL